MVEGIGLVLFDDGPLGVQTVDFGKGSEGAFILSAYVHACGSVETYFMRMAKNRVAPFEVKEADALGVPK